MENPGTLPLAAALAVFALLETVLFTLRRFAPRFPVRPLDHLWAVLAAAWAGLSFLGLGPADPLWRVVAAAALVLAVLVGFSALERLVLLRPWDTARGPMAPKLARDVLRVLLLAGAALTAATAIFDVNLSTVLVSSTVVSAVLGLALQDVLKNVFAGIALDVEKPFARRDWLRMDDGTPAQVIDMSWRATRLRTNEGLEIHQPNSEVAAARLVSYGSGVRPVALSFEVGLPYETPPAEAKAALAAAARQAPGALDSPGPQVFLHQFADHAVVYRMRVWTRGVHELVALPRRRPDPHLVRLEAGGDRHPLPHPDGAPPRGGT
jgi:small-conductance mechanosensitive channel